MLYDPCKLNHLAPQILPQAGCSSSESGPQVKRSVISDYLPLKNFTIAFSALFP